MVGTSNQSDPEIPIDIYGFHTSQICCCEKKTRIPGAMTAMTAMTQVESADFLRCNFSVIEI